MDSPRDVLRDVLNGIANVFALLSNWLLFVADWVQGWPWIDRLSITFQSMSDWFADISWWFVSLRDPLLSMYDATMEILNWASIQAQIRSWLTDIELIITWFVSWWNNVIGVIDSWWDVVRWDVRNWISIAVQGLAGLLVAWDNFWAITWPDLIGKFNTLAAAWDNFWTHTLPTLVDFAWIIAWWNARLLDIADLINSAFILRDSLWEGWQELRDQVTEFFTDPEDWLYKAVDRIVDRFW